MKGEKGSDLFGKEIEPRPVPGLNKKRYLPGRGVKRSEDGLSLETTTWGTLLIDKPNLSVKSPLSISKDGMQAHLDFIFRPDNFNAFTPYIIKDLFTAEGVVHGIKAETIASFFLKVQQTKTPERGVLIAQGTPPIDGEDTRINFLFTTGGEDPLEFDAGRKFRTQEEHDLTPRAFVQEGEELAVVTLKVPAQKGRTVKGEALQGNEGKDRHLRSSNCVKTTDKGKSFIARIAGYADVSDGILTVINPVEASKDKMEAYITIHPPVGERTMITISDIQKILKITYPFL